MDGLEARTIFFEPGLNFAHQGSAFPVVILASARKTQLHLFFIICLEQLFFELGELVLLIKDISHVQVVKSLDNGKILI